MKFVPPLQKGKFIKRYKRFMVDVELDNGEVLTVHCANTGSMRHCMVPGSPCWFSDSGNLQRKYPHTLEIVTTVDGERAAINTARPNALVEEAIENGLIRELQGYDELRREVKYGSRNSRIDILLSRGDECCYVEVKNQTYGLGDGWGRFPDAVTSRGTKHLQELMEVAAAGHRAVMVFCVQNSGVSTVGVAEDIDPLYAATLREAQQRGVEVLAYRCEFNARGASLVEALPVRI